MLATVVAGTPKSRPIVGSATLTIVDSRIVMNMAATYTTLTATFGLTRLVMLPPQRRNPASGQPGPPDVSGLPPEPGPGARSRAARHAPGVNAGPPVFSSAGPHLVAWQPQWVTAAAACGIPFRPLWGRCRARSVLVALSSQPGRRLRTMGGVTHAISAKHARRRLG